MHLFKQFMRNSRNQLKYRRENCKQRARFELLEPRLCLSGTAEIYGAAYFGEDPNTQPLAGIKIFLDENENGLWEQGESWKITNGDGEYSFTGLEANVYRVTEVVPEGYTLVDPVNGYHTVELADAQIEEDVDFEHGGNMASMVDVFILIDNTGSFVGQDDVLENAVNDIIEGMANSTTGLYPDIDWAFGVGCYAEYAHFALASSPEDDRPFVLCQPIIEYGTVWSDGGTTVTFDDAIGSALDRITTDIPLEKIPGDGGDLPETMVEALYQVATGEGFDGNDGGDGDTSDSGDAGLYATQITPGSSGDVPILFGPIIAQVGACLQVGHGGRELQGSEQGRGVSGDGESPFDGGRCAAANALRCDGVQRGLMHHAACAFSFAIWASSSSSSAMPVK